MKGAKRPKQIKVTKEGGEEKHEYTFDEGDLDDLFSNWGRRNHLSGLFAYYAILNQEFFNYVISCNLTGRQSKILFFLLATAGLGGEVDLSNENISRALKISEDNVSREINLLVKKKIILKRKKRNYIYGIKINYEEINIPRDMINPLFLFKNRVTKENVEIHKAMMNQESPYIKQFNIEGGIDMINPENNQVFFQISKEEMAKHKIGTLKAPDKTKKLTPKEAFNYTNYEEISDTPPALPPMTQEEFELFKDEILKEVEDIARKRLEYMSKSKEPKPEPEPKRLYRVRQKEE